MIDYFDRSELEKLGFAELGINVRISRTATIYNRGNVAIGNHVRIDNFCVIAPSGAARFQIGSHVHISAFNFINGLANISVGDFVTTSPRVSIFSSSDDYSGDNLTGATIPAEWLGTRTGAVSIERHVIIGTGSVIMPGVTVAEGSAIGALSFVSESTAPFGVYAGVPAIRMKERGKGMIDQADRYARQREDQG